MRSVWALLVQSSFTSYAIIASALNLDPVKNYCVRYDHQSIVKNGILYIYGGSETFVDVQDSGAANGPVTIGYNEHMISVDLTKSWDWRDNIIEKVTNITANPRTATLPPLVVRGTLFQGSANDDNIYLYGGTTSYANTSFSGWRQPIDAVYSLWSYDTATRGWNQYDVGIRPAYRPNSGAAAEAPDQGLAFYYGGEIDDGSSLSTNGVGIDKTTLLSGMVKINVSNYIAQNLSTFSNVDRLRIHGKMQYIPSLGEKGILVLLGGSDLEPGLNGPENATLTPMTKVGIFDVASLYNSSTPNGIWYQQTATGHPQNISAVPSPRIDFCLVVATSQDSSSHNIYMYGGRDVTNTPIDETWILSLPTFTWINVASGFKPRFSHTCHMVGNRTMFSVGGVQSPAQMQGLAEAGGEPCDYQIQGLGWLDMSTITWGGKPAGGYNAITPAYEVPMQVVSVIGGSPTGNATLKGPPQGFDQSDLGQILGVYTNVSTPKPLSSHSKHHIVSIACPISVTVGLGIFFLLSMLIRRKMKRRTNQQSMNHQNTATPPYEMDGEQRTHTPSLSNATEGSHPSHAAQICDSEGTNIVV